MKMGFDHGVMVMEMEKGLEIVISWNNEYYIAVVEETSKTKCTSP